MLDYSKFVLQRVYPSEHLFKRNLLLFYSILKDKKYELNDFIEWTEYNFGHSYSDVISEVFYKTKLNLKSA